MSESLAEFERLRRSGDEHFSRRDYSIAAACYEAAQRRGSGDRHFLFNYAYSLAEIGNHALAASVYERAINAGSGAAAHNNRGGCLRTLGRLKEACDEFQAAAKLNSANALYWRSLAVCSSDLKDNSGWLRALEALVRCDDCTADDWNNLGIARERDGDIEGALAAFIGAARITPSGIHFHNIALMQDRLGRVLDAFHACRHALRLNASYENALKMLPRLQTAVQDLCASLPTTSESALREVGPHDYINPYILLNVPEPLCLMSDEEYWFEKPEDWEELFGSFAKRKRALRAELELNDGRVSWLEQLSINEEAVHRVLRDLDDSGWHPHHWAVFKLPLLNGFLMHGDGRYFCSTEHAPYPLAALFVGATPEDYEHQEFTEFISPYFTARCKEVLKIALETRMYERVRAVSGISAPVTAADMDEMIEPLRRFSIHRRGELEEMATALEKDSNAKGNTQLERAASEARMLNALPRHLGAKLREGLCIGYRSISIALANHANDYAMAERALRAAEGFHTSGSVRERLANDRKAISNLLKQEQEEQQREQALTLRLTLKSWFRERILEITPEKFRWHEDSIAAEQITGIRYGITIKYTNGVKTGADSLLAVSGAGGTTVFTDWLDEHNFSGAVQSLLGLHAHRILSRLVTCIKGSVGCQIGQFRLDKQGINFETGLFFTKQVLIPWSDVVTQTGAGNVQIFTRSSSKAQASVSCRENWNACLLPTLVKIMQNPAA